MRRFITALACVVSVFGLIAGSSAIDPPIEAGDALSVPIGPYLGEVVSVHDGDTATIKLQLGLRVEITEEIRVYGINAPERYAKGGIESRDALRLLLPERTRVRVTLAKQKNGKPAVTFTRYVGKIERQVGADAMDVAPEMVNQGQAGWADKDANPLVGPPPPI